MLIERLHLVTPADTAADITSVLDAALSAGAPLVQARSKGADDRRRLTWTTAVRDRCTAAGASVVVNDRVDLALAVAAAGVHLGDEDIPVAVARQLLGPDAVIGVTCRDPEQARRAADDGASYLGAGPAYATDTKTGLPPALGPRGIAAVAEAVDLPVIAIAGVTPERVGELRDAGAHGVAVVSAVFSAPDPAAVTRSFLEALGCG